MAEPYEILVPDRELDLLKQRLTLARLPDELDGAAWEYGAPLADVKRLASRWRDGFDWRAQEAKINEALPQFTSKVPVDGFGTLKIHFVHARSMVEDAIPLLFVHGWPGSFLEVAKVLPLWTDGSGPKNPCFHVVALSLPGYGFSDAPKKQGFHLTQYAEVCNKLMLSLGYSEYVCQGGDWGSLICRTLATLYGGTSVKAWHVNMPWGAPPSPRKEPLSALQHALTPYSASETAATARMKWFATWGDGYGAVQRTRPQTIGYSLTDSPVGLLAWVYEKLVEWTDSYPWTDDEVLTWVSIYWHSTAGPAASVRIYYEVNMARENVPALLPAVAAPTGVSIFPQDIYPSPASWMRHSTNLVFERRHDRGGHFAATETPELLAQDVRDMFRKGGPAYGVVKGKTGYGISAKL